MNSKKISFTLLFIAGFLFSSGLPPRDDSGRCAAFAQENWQADFDDVCSRTQDAMALNKIELTALVERCDKLKPLIDKLEEPKRRVYLKRLTMCRDLFVYVLKTRQDK